MSQLRCNAKYQPSRQLRIHDRCQRFRKSRRPQRPVGAAQCQRSWTSLCHRLCVGCDTVQADHAPEAGVAQGIFHGILVRRHGGIQEEVDERLEDEVERHKEERTLKNKCACR